MFTINSLFILLTITTTKANLQVQYPTENATTSLVEVRNEHNSALFDDLQLKYCRKTAAKCQQLTYNICMGTKVPYTSTTLELTDLKTQMEIKEKLTLFEYLRYIPKCWAVIQPFLCAIYMPKCENDLVDLPSKDMCRIALKPCRIFYNTSILPEFFNCEDPKLFSSKCKNNVHDLKFNTTGFCMEPLIKTDHSDWFYSGIEGCGLRCKESFYTEYEQKQIHKLIGTWVIISMLCNGFTIITFLIDWATANKYPALAIFFINVCFFISYFGWAAQFVSNDARDDIICKKDGTLRKYEPSARENLSCVVVFVTIYYFLIAGIVWFVIFCYTWYMSSLQALGKIQERVDRKRSYFHLFAWSIPLILTITIMALGEIDGNYVSGICFISRTNPFIRLSLLILPLIIGLIISGYIIICGLVLLIKVKIDSREIISIHSSRKIRSNIVRMGVFALFMLVFCSITFFYHWYLYYYSEIWEESLKNYITCKLTSFSSDYSHCKQEFRPSVAMLQLQLLAVFGSGIGMASWICCSATLRSWARYFRRKFHCEREERIKLQKHKIIAQAFAKRKKFNEGGKISIDCQNYTDPVGLHFDLNSEASNGLSTTWAANLPRLVNRRCAVINDGQYSISSNNQSIDSEVSLSVRHVSIESRRNSGDSQLSVQIAELKATRKINSTTRHHHHHHHRSSRHHHHHQRNHHYSTSATSTRNCYTKYNNKNSNGGNKRKLSKELNKSSIKLKNIGGGSSSSLDSHLQLLNALTNNENIKNLTQPNLNRRKATAGLDNNCKLLTNGKLLLPYNLSNTNNNNNKSDESSASEDENVSVTISESKFNMILNNTTTTTNNLDLNDQLVMKSLREGVHIIEINSNSNNSESDDDDDDDGNQSKDNYLQQHGIESRESKRTKRRSSRKKYNSSSCSSNSSLNNSSEDDESCPPEIQKLIQNNKKELKNLSSSSEDNDDENLMIKNNDKVSIVSFKKSKEIF